MLPLISLSLGLSILCGLNLYLVTFLASWAVRQGWVETSLHPALAALGHPAITVVALLLFLTEFVLDKMPWVDSLWDAVHTIIRPLGAAWLSLTLMRGMDLPGGNGTAALLASLAGLLALGTHLTKSGIRLLINASPEPFSNILASLAEDLVVVLLVLLLIQAPVSGFAVCLGLLAVSWIVLPRLLRVVKTSIFLMWKKFTGSGHSRPNGQRELPVDLGAAHEAACRAVLGPDIDPSPAWAVPCISGKISQVPGLRTNIFGTLVAPSQHPGVLLFAYRSGFRSRSVRISLADCSFRQERTLLSENLVIHRTHEGLLDVFRFPPADGDLVGRLVQDLRSRLGLEVPALPPVPNPSVLPPFNAGTPEVWTPPQSA